MNDTNKIKYLSFSLWGDSPIYTKGAIRNAALAREVYSDWRMQVYHDDSVPLGILAELRSNGVNLIDMSASFIYPLFWRFLAADQDDCDYAIFRDTDSRLTLRERKAVDEWIQQGSVLHIMRDHPYHHIPFGADGMGVLGGMWGIKGRVIRLEPLIRKFIAAKENEYGIDQAFLQQIYQQFSNSKTVHDEFFEKKAFPIKRTGYRFVGERMDEYDQPIGDDWKHIKRHKKPHRSSFLSRVKRFLTK